MRLRYSYCNQSLERDAASPFVDWQSVRDEATASAQTVLHSESIARRMIVSQHSHLHLSRNASAHERHVPLGFTPSQQEGKAEAPAQFPAGDVAGSTPPQRHYDNAGTAPSEQGHHKLN
ncbi:hypothetical protein SKAU_G00369080 [Synaphobranchus kaupii]|uniref:Uncharacterized protein n=1 Tax=Synaphobranchus kaupii TaxID=118154 RepID=A0A9Q1EFP9_SYNKA|nr:hypothetical protein SKAU_G00369080 [Synaphobranchus kaupii]